MLFCKLGKVPVLDVCFFRIGNPAGYVVHGEAINFNTAFLISIGPFIINSLLCMLICFPAYTPIYVFSISSPLSYFLLWLGVSIGMHSFPSNQDAKNLFEKAKESTSTFNPLALISFPLIVLIYIANLLSFFWADLIYGLAIGIGLPSLIL